MTNRLLGCISSAENEQYAKKYGVQSDRERIEELAAPWDKTDKPSIITWNKSWETYLKKEAAAMDNMRENGKLPPVWEIAKRFGYNLRELCDSIQKGNDCTAWGTTRAAICLALYQKFFGAEIDVEKYNPSGVYAYSSGTTPRADRVYPDTGRTIYGIAETACEVGNFPVASIGAYSNTHWFSQKMIDNVDTAEKNQMGWVYISEQKTAEQLADIIILSLRACRPCIIGNTVALQDGTALNQDGVYVSEVGGGWGGGHATAACDIKKVGNKYYPFIYNSHGALYPAPDGRPPEGTYITRDGLIRYLSGSFADIMPVTYIERPRVEYYNLNIGGNLDG